MPPEYLQYPVSNQCEEPGSDNSALPVELCLERCVSACSFLDISVQASRVPLLSSGFEDIVEVGSLVNSYVPDDFLCD